DAQINCGDCFSVISKKCPPALRRWLRRSNHVFRDRRLSNFESEHQKLAMDPRCAPQRVFLTHPSDEIAQLTIDLWPPCLPSGFPAPQGLEPAAIPPQDRLRLPPLQKTQQMGPDPRDPHQHPPAPAGQPQRGRPPPQGDIELMTEK